MGLTTPGPNRAGVRRLAFGRAISRTGSVAATIALTFSIYQKTGSAAWIAATMVLTLGVTGLFSPIAGALGDRFDRRRVMLVCEAAGAACWIGIAIVTQSPVHLLSLAFVASVIESPFLPASGAAIPNLAGPELLSWANSLIAVGRYSGLTLGPVVGGILVSAIGTRGVFVANAVSFAMSMALVASVRGPYADPKRAVERETKREVAVGIRLIVGDRVLRLLLFSFVVFYMGMAGTLVADPILARTFGTGSVGYGVLTACWGGGTIAGVLLARHIRPDREARWLIGSSCVAALTSFGVALAPSFWIVLIFVVGFGFADGPTQVVEQNLLQRRTPDHVRGRVMGAWEAFIHIAQVGAFLLGAAVVSAVGPQGAYALGGAMGMIATAIVIPLFRLLSEGVPLKD